jgi:hypothetical protein
MKELEVKEYTSMTDLVIQRLRKEFGEYYKCPHCKKYIKINIQVKVAHNQILSIKIAGIDKAKVIPLKIEEK